MNVSLWKSMHLVSPHDAEQIPPLNVDRDDELLIWTLARPEKANALSLDLIEAMLTALDQAEADLSGRAVVIVGQGRNFCAGADLSALMEGEGAIRPIMDALRTLLRRLESSRLAIVAGVHGAARAGGLELALACDAVVAARTATFGDAHLAHGLLPAGGSSARLPRTIGWQRAKWMILSARTISADTAAQWGLVTDVCDNADVLTAAKCLARELTRADPETFLRAKHLFGTLADRSFSDALESEIALLERHAKSSSFRAGISRFLTRKQPQ